MLPNEKAVLCVSIHDVAPGTWPECLRLLQAVRAVADIPLTWLVVPHYHGRAVSAPGYEQALGSLLAQGHELALHGYTHLDTAPAQPGLRDRFLRTVFTQREGEFAAIDTSDARRRIELGMGWFAERGWPLSGFVAPAWLIGSAAWRALREFPFEYTTTIGHLHLLETGRRQFAPTLVYAARNRGGRVLSPLLAGAMGTLLAEAPVLRLALHPSDARHPALLRHAQHLLERLLAARSARTKVHVARAYQRPPMPQKPRPYPA